MNMTTHLHHLDPASSRAARVASALMRLERENVKAVIARRLIDVNIAKHAEARNK